MTVPTTLSAMFPQAVTAFEMLLTDLAGDAAMAMTHADLEAHIATHGRGVLRAAMQDQLDLRALREARRDDVVDAAGTRYSSVESNHTRPLTTILGEVQVGRKAYRKKGHPNLYPTDAELNLPREQYSHGLRKLAAIEATRGSYEETVAAIARATGQTLGKRQVEELVQRAAADFEAFYTATERPDVPPEAVLVLSVDGKGVIMRPEALRPATAKAAAKSQPKLATRVSPGEKRDRKRMAEVGAVYDVRPVIRTPEDVLRSKAPKEPASPAGGEAAATQAPPAAPVAENKWVTASVVDNVATVVEQVFNEAEQRDPTHAREWIALVDGNNDQINQIEAQAQARGIKVTMHIDCIHWFEYLWLAAWCFFAKGDAEAEAWVRTQALAILRGNASVVAAAMGRKATVLGLNAERRKAVDKCVQYLLNKKDYLDYPTALARGWPIGTGVIEGACRYLVQDRMDRTGARWGLRGAESVLKLRALMSNGDFDVYWAYHCAREHDRVHRARYAPEKTSRVA